MNNSISHPANPVIAIDGPAASGKSTVAVNLSRRLNYIFVPTGSMYRAVTWWMIEKQVVLDDSRAICKALPECEISYKVDGLNVQLLIDGVDPEPFIRSAEVNAGVSKVAAIPEVRDLLVAKQRSLISFGSLVMEGRDIGTVVFPETPYKFFVDADPAIRAARRHAQGEQDSVAQRDAIDSQRKAAPLKKAENAFLLDSGKLDQEEIVEVAMETLLKMGLDDAKKALAKSVSA